MPKRVIRELKLSHIAAVDRPCQEGARAILIKRAPDDAWDALAKLDLSYARSFAEIVIENEQREARWRADQEMWPLFDALRDTLSSIAADQVLDQNQKLTRVQESVSEFVAALRAKWPDVADEISEIAKVSKDAAAMAPFLKAEASESEMEVDMDELAKLKQQVADLEKKNGELETHLSAANTAKAAAEGEVTAATAKVVELETRVETLEKAADETITVAGNSVSKREVGATQFAVFKGLQNEAETARLEKRADDEFGSLPGTTAERAAVLKHMASAPEDVRKAFDAIATTAEKAMSGAFESLGHRPSAETRKAAGDFMAKVEEVKKRDGIGKSDAMTKARREFPAEFEAYQNAGS